VLAELRISSLFCAQPEEGHMPRLVNKAKSIGADAVMFVQGKIFFSTNYGARSGTGQDTGDEKQPTLTTASCLIENDTEERCLGKGKVGRCLKWK
jgi:hypothetical protein